MMDTSTFGSLVGGGGARSSVASMQGGDGLRDSLSDPLLDSGAPDGLMDVRQAAGVATAGAGKPLPNLGAIQKSFGQFDVSGVKAHTGAAAAEGTAAVGARGMAVGGHVALGEAASLHTEAHEAAHIVQQSAGVHLDTGDGASEAHADAVADRVVQGKSAVDLLSQVAEPGPAVGGGSSVQLDLMNNEELATYGTAGGTLFGKTAFGHIVHRLDRYHKATEPAEKRTHALKILGYIKEWRESGSRKTSDKEKEALDKKKGKGLDILEVQAQTEAEFIRMKDDSVGTAENPALHAINVGGRPTMPRMVPSTAPLFGDGEPSMKGVQQGALGNCWLLAGVATLVNQDPGFIKTMMVDNGTSVTVRLFGDKGPEFFKVSKDVPKLDLPRQDGEGTREVDAFGKSNLWVQMIEKAVAQRTGSYKASEGAKGDLAFTMLTGKPSTKLGAKAEVRRLPWPGGGEGKDDDLMCKKVARIAVGENVNAWWTFALAHKGEFAHAKSLESVAKIGRDHPEEIEDGVMVAMGEYLRREQLLPGKMGTGAYTRLHLDLFKFIVDAGPNPKMTAGTNKSIGTAESRGASGEEKVDGMAGGHQYNILGTKVEGNRRFIQVRNPWGKYSREYDENEDGSLKAKAKAPGEGDDGISWIELADFARMFANDVYKQ